MVESSFELTGRTAVVVGATSGLGRAIAGGLVRAGAQVVVAGRRRELLDELCAEIEKSGGLARGFAADVCDTDSIGALAKFAEAEFGATDILVNAAGITSRRPTAEVPIGDWDELLNANLTGMLRTCQAFYDLLRTSRRARIINIASLSSFVAFHEVAAYGVSKAGVLALTRSLGCEWAPDGINVNALVPGVFRTELNEHLLNETARGRELLIRTPMKRFGQTEEIVGAAVFLASDAASFMTGQSLVIDGGFLASGVNC